MKEIHITGNAKYVSRKEDVNLFKSLMDSYLYTQIPAVTEKKNVPDKIFRYNSMLWEDILKKECYPEQIVTLSGFHLTEWIPLAPGRFFTTEALQARSEAQRFIANTLPDKTIIGPSWRPTESNLFLEGNSYEIPELGTLEQKSYPKRIIKYNPMGKEKMITGGIGSLRLASKLILGKEYYLVGASSSGVSHEGITILVEPDMYAKIISSVKENGGMIVNITGRLKILPQELSIVVPTREVPRYCLMAEEIEILDKSVQSELITSVAVSYYQQGNTYSPSMSFCSFSPDKNDKQLKDAAEWINKYAIEYSDSPSPLIRGDFDEFITHFDHVDFPLMEISNGKISIEKLQEYVQNNAIIINEKVLVEKFHKTSSAQPEHDSPLKVSSGASSVKKQRILFLTSNPNNEKRIRTDLEAREIEESLKRAEHRDLFEFNKQTAVRTKDFRRAILACNPTILHFAGHGNVEGIVLEDETGNSNLVTGSALSSLFKTFKEFLQCIILNACYSETQAIEIVEHVPYVIGMSSKITDAAAVVFASSFYDGLGAGHTIDKAFLFALAAIKLEGIEEDEVPVLITNAR